MALALFFTVTNEVMAVPANPALYRYVQPDGTVVTLQMRGDEFLHYVTTVDGYTLKKNAHGYYVYASRTKSGALGFSSVVAHDEDQRGSEEKAFLAQTPKCLTDSHEVRNAGIYALQRKMIFDRPLISLAANQYDYTKFRGLVILVEFNDRTFSRPDAKDVFSEMLNKKNFTGIKNLDGGFVKYTGSVRDYFEDNSFGKFIPQFDVVGPVKVNVSCTYPEGLKNARSFSQMVMKAADPIVDFSKYDCDGDGTVEMVYFICAGYGSHYVGNNSGFIWPHAWTLLGDRHDGVRLDRYACSSEMYGGEATTELDGVGTICHEFSHVLGLMDEYDTDYEKGGGQSFHPDNWSIMAGGNHINMGRTPVGYTLFQRYQAGFSTPTLVEGETTLTIPSLAETGEGYRINSAVDKEYFLLENRQASKWDAFLPATGLIVTRVDSTDVRVWSANTINCNPAHNYLEIVRAVEPTKVGSFNTDVFPQPNVRSLTNETMPSMRSWTGKKTPLVLGNIRRRVKNIIVNVVEDKTVTGIESLQQPNEGITEIYDLSGRKLNRQHAGGLNIVVKTDAQGNRKVYKTLNGVR